MADPEPPPEQLTPDALRRELHELLEKYDLLLRLHADAPGRSPARREAMRAVATRFPGALREWDKLPQPELLRRRNYLAELLRAAERDALAVPELRAAEAWLLYTLDLHRCLRVLLKERPLQPSQPGRRISELAYAQVAERHHVSATAIKEAIHLGLPAMEK
jgi:hypothetical protein